MTDSEQVDEKVLPAENSNRKLWIGGIALAIAVVIAGVAFATGGDTKWSDNNANAPEEVVSETIADVEEEVAPEPALEARGVIAAKNESTIASSMTARITEMPFREGRSFRRGALLARFDCSTIEARLTAARAATVAYQNTYETNVELDSYEAVGRNEVAVSRANLDQSRAEANAISAQLRDCAVYAPFSGTVVEEIASRGEVAASGQPLLRIQSGGDLEAELIVPSNWLTWLRPGAEFQFVIDETGAVITGEVSQLGATVDPVSKTIRVSANIVSGDALVLPGMSGTATFEQPVPDPAQTGGTEGAPVASSTEGAATNGREPS